MATVSRQSAFWAVVALGLNTFVQPGGKVLDFPAEYSRALRLSPIVCIIDTLGVLYSVAFFSCRTGSFKDGFTLAARYRCLTEDDPAEPKLEGTWWFRFSIFAFGALPQAVKLLAMGGVPLTKIWGMAYLVSFLVLEGFDLLQPRERRDDHLLETNVKVLNMKNWLPGYYAVVIQLFCFDMEPMFIPSGLDSKCDSVRGNSPPQPEFGKVMGVLYRTACLALVVVPPCIIIIVSTVTAALLLTFLAWAILCQETAFKFRWFRELFGVISSKRGKTSISLLFAAGNIASVFCYYMFIYDPSSTYKPPWTEKR